MDTNNPLIVFLTWLLAGGGLAVLLQRIPNWDAINPNLKRGIVMLIGFLGPIILSALKIYIPPEYLNQTIGQIFIGLITSAGMFILHLVDVWLTGKSRAAKLAGLEARKTIKAIS